MNTLYQDFILKEILLPHFRSHPAPPGERYYLIIEDDDKRASFREAICRFGTPITVENIYQGNSHLLSNEDRYITTKLSPSPTGETPDIIVAYDEYAPCETERATEDYLTTIRNAVGRRGSGYENYCILFILKKSGLSSIDSSFRDLQNPGETLHAASICDTIKRKIREEHCFNTVAEEQFVEVHLNNIMNYVEDGVYSLFDFSNILSVLGAGSLKDHYAELGFFPEDPSALSDLSERDLYLRAEENHERFNKVLNAMGIDDEDNRRSALSKFLDDDLTESLMKKDEGQWKDTSYNEVCTSISQKEQTDCISLESIRPVAPLQDANLVYYTKGNIRKKSTSYILVCNTGTTDYSKLILIFNQRLSKKIVQRKSADCMTLNGTRATVAVGNKVIRFSVGIGNNKHLFVILRLPLCPASFLASIKQNFTITAKGILNYDVPEGTEKLILGSGESNVELLPDESVNWTPDTSYSIPTTAEDNETRNFLVTFHFGDSELPIQININNKIIPPIRPSTIDPTKHYHLLDNSEEPYTRISDEEGNCPAVWSEWRRYLEYEDNLLQGECHCLIVNDDETIEAGSLNLPPEVAKTYRDIQNYYRSVTSIPSIWGYTDRELRELYINYSKAVIHAIEQIKTGVQLPPDVFDLTLLGTVRVGHRLMLSPLHPLLVAYREELRQLCTPEEEKHQYAQLLSPFYAIPFLGYGEGEMSPYTDSIMLQIKNWLAYEPVQHPHQEKTNSITDKVVTSRMESFVRHFPYLFSHRKSPIIISAIGIKDDTCMIRGIINYICRHFDDSAPQKIELHAYVDNIMKETFFERLNRLNTLDSVARDLENKGITFDKSADVSDIIRVLFRRVSFYKHRIDHGTKMSHCHIAFYQMDSGKEFTKPATDTLRSEQALFGLASIPSTGLNNIDYYIGFGRKDVTVEHGILPPMIRELNTLYANASTGGANACLKDICLAKRYRFDAQQLLQEIYESSNWVTFLYPEVDINFFYTQRDVNIIHYTDQYDLNARYDSITVTYKTHLDLYTNILKQVFARYAKGQGKLDDFVRRMIPYFNCLNGNWLLNIVNETAQKARERMSIVATCAIMKQFLSRIPDVEWIPLSLEDILRVTGSIGLEMNHLFSKKSMGAHGPMSDDLLMIGFDLKSPLSNPTLYLYPVEVKYSEGKSNGLSEKGHRQVTATLRILRKELSEEHGFISHLYRTFFASQFLTVSEKLHAYGLISDEIYDRIDKSRYSLMNCSCTMSVTKSADKVGEAAVVSYYEGAHRSICTGMDSGIAVCELTLDTDICYEAICQDKVKGATCLRDLENQLDLSVQAHLQESINRIDPIDKEEDDNEDEEGEQNQEKKSDDIPSFPTVFKETTHKYINICLGREVGSGKPFLFHPNDTKHVSHPNMGIIGTMGTGKTELAKSIIAQFAREGEHNLGGTPVGLLIFDYKGDYYHDDFLEKVGGTSYNCNLPFNPLRIAVPTKPDGRKMVRITADTISNALAISYNLGVVQQYRIKEVILEAYHAAGINDEAPSTWTKPAPTMAQVINLYFNSSDGDNAPPPTDKAYALFDKLRAYAIFAEDDAECVSIFQWLDRVRVIDIHNYPPDAKRAIVSLILELFYSEMKQQGSSLFEDGVRELRSMILVDEAHQFMNQGFNSLRLIMSEGRMFGVGMILSTQSISDFKSKNGEAYADFISSWAVLRSAGVNKASIANIFGEQDKQKDALLQMIQQANVHHSVCKIGNTLKYIHNLPFFDLIKEDPRFKEEQADKN